MVVKGPFKVAG